MRKTKIICTIGPASMNEETLTAMAKAGMNVARMNFSHGDHEEQGMKMDLVKKVRKKLNLPIAILLDTKGPEYRIRTFKDGSVTVKEGDTFIFTTDDVEGDETRVSVSHKNLHKDLSVGDTLSVCNGIVFFEVTDIKGHDVITKCTTGGTMSNKKSMSFPNKVMSGPYLSEQDKKDILFGIENDIDFIAASFVSTKQDMVELRTFLDENGGEDVEVIAKIENQPGVDNVEEILEIANGIMVARGDLGVEIPFVKLPAVQKELISKARALGKRVVTATEMLESMISNPRPTRAEISDVANAVYDGTSAIMLSGESAQGKYPVQAVATMAEIAETTENDINYEGRFHKEEIEIKSTPDAVCHSTCSMAIDVNAKAIVACTMSGYTARRVSRFRCPVDTIAMTTDKKVWRKLALSWGVTPVLVDKFTSLDVMFYYALGRAKQMLDLKKGDSVVLTGGPIDGHSGNTNTIKVEAID
ncbi:MAG: pyruvate kinase [Pseudobutyrivibrio sp.]|uniref:Pyruvate kinase n=2 Tax=Pseudobutyrivibrio TaxID=46205 RepID=A0A2G3E7V1_9FIRM|nr:MULTISPECIES: pyruvate kinase [Pseudobutyrivibrio]MBE5904171.1 pyruvate kinase [Pseudobutyrivibrio sp.]NEX00394.1 pyruvate kinase [Pseudobutyrivibrio xylanivorans]PHU39251.1 pyruvate kinase [Pseudobutyrivibrio ruminis]SCY16959.1 pyruvate kinase [Pseudobutyrivibrio sp. AR14]SFR84672.1 pyruvate kinase [Pseudobutyrivibrio sp. NOR37]